MHLSIHIDLGVKTQEVRQAGVGRDEVWERTRQRQQGRYALASRHEDTWDTQPWVGGIWVRSLHVSFWQAAALCEHAPVSKHHTVTGIGRKE